MTEVAHLDLQTLIQQVYGECDGNLLRGLSEITRIVEELWPPQPFSREVPESAAPSRHSEPPAAVNVRRLKNQR